MFLKKKKNLIVILVIILLIGISVLIFNIGKSIISETKKKDEMKMTISEIVDNSYLYFLLSEGIIPVKDEIIEVDGITYKIVDLDKIKTMDDINNLVNSLFVEDLRTDRFNKVFENRKFIELESGLYVNYNQDDACNKVDSSNLKDYTFEKRLDDKYIINTYYGENYIVYENDEWYLKGELLQCTDGLPS